MEQQFSEGIGRYFDVLEKSLNAAYSVAEKARKKGFDPEDYVDIPVAKNMAERVENLVAAVTPQISGCGIAKRIQELEKIYGSLNLRVAFVISEEVSCEKFCKFRDKKEAMETGIRTGFAYLTGGVVSAPLEGFIELRIKKRKDGAEYIAASYAGPVRGAGGTAASLSVVLVDYIRTKMGYSSYDPDENEISRFNTELEDYHERVTNLQYKPTREEIDFLIKNLPVEVDGDPTEKIEVSNYKDLPRLQTNRIRGGLCLVVSMVALKAPKLWKELKKMRANFGIDWSFLEKFLEIQKAGKAKKSQKVQGKISPDYTYISDLVAGRPVLSLPLAQGGFRLRYGKTRLSGYSAVAINPLTMQVLDKFLATGTQLKLERPGKAAVVTPCETIEPPIVRLANGNVVRFDSTHRADEISEVIYLGDILISYGDFFDRVHPLVPAGYCEEWHYKELEKAVIEKFGSMNFQKLSALAEISEEELTDCIKNPNFKISLELSKKLSIPMHPRYTYYWGALSLPQLGEMLAFLRKAEIKPEGQACKIIMPFDQKIKRSLELIGIPHTLASGEFIVIEREEASAFSATLGFSSPDELEGSIKKFRLFGEDGSIHQLLAELSGIRMIDKGGTFIGARMGRPEKAKMRKLTGGPHVLFPVGNEGGRQRSFQAAIEFGTVKSNFPLYRCDACSKETIFGICETCGKKTKKLFYCNLCGRVENCGHESASFLEREIDIGHYFNASLKHIGASIHPDVIKGVKGTSSKDHIPEHLAKGILRAKHSIYVNKDGTTRFDMTEAPITHFKPREIKTGIEKLKELGYEKDIGGNPLESKEQVIELKPQDIIIPLGSSIEESSASALFRISKFVDDLLESFYGLEPFYMLGKEEDIVGHLTVVIAPHISAGITARIIGFSQTQTLMAHPLLHAAIRRDCDGDEACMMLLLDALLNFSRQYLPDSRGGRTMDAPLLLASRIVPAEVDDMVQRLDVGGDYPLELYNAALEFKSPGEIKMELLGDRLNTPLQYEGLRYTHKVIDMNSGNLCSAYKTLPSMEEKMKRQMRLAEIIRAVDARYVAKLVIEKHLLKDIKGNLRKFSHQQFRCVKCNHKFRRPPLIGKCGCNGRIIFTVSEGSITKYLAPAISLAEKYEIPAYTRQALDLTKRRVEEVFGKESEKQEGLGRWFG